MPGLQFSQRIDLAIHGLWALARCFQGQHLVLVSEIARTQHVSTSYLAKVFQQLSHAGQTGRLWACQTTNGDHCGRYRTGDEY
jgi:hypothetical protein